MKYLLIGSNGFIGKSVARVLGEAKNDLYLADRGNTDEGKNVSIDLFDKKSIENAIAKVNPDVIINLAGNVENSEKALEINPVFTRNLLDVILDTKNDNIKKIIITGSAGEYGEVKKEGSVDENQPLLGQSFYARSKIEETSLAMDYKKKHGLPINIVRIFNPIGVGMHPRFLIPSLIRQVKEISDGQVSLISINRLDSKRDYANVRDIARAIVLISEKEKTNKTVYNLGSGKATSNKELIDIVIKACGIKKKLSIKELSDNPEPKVADMANITRIQDEFGWEPEISLENTILEIKNERDK